MSFKVAAIQMCSGTSVEKNVETLKTLVRDAAGQGAIYVQTPEMTGSLQRNRKALFAAIRPEETDLVAAAAAELARDLKIHLHIGSTAIDIGEGKVANRALVYGPDGVKIASYDKIHMFDVDLDNGESWRESATYQPGCEARVLSLPFARVGLAVCYDVRFPHLFRTQALAGAEILTAPAAFTRQTGEAHWGILQRARAIENGAFMISAAQAGVHEDGRETYGHSIIVDPWGRVLVEAGGAGEAVLVAEIDIADVVAARGKIPNLKNSREFALVDQA